MIQGQAGAPRVVELFAGCGGMAIGLGHAGFGHDLLVEWNRDAAATVAHNVGLETEGVEGWDYVCSDVRAIAWNERTGRVDMVAGGPPCQPFSMGGKAGGQLDPRDMWPEAVRAVREIRPEAFLFENVKGLLRSAFTDYLDSVIASLSRPSVERQPGECARAFTRRIAVEPKEYKVRVFSVNAADYGAAQKRHRVLIAGIRSDLPAEPFLPTPTHSEDRLLWEQWVTSDYWRRHSVAVPAGPPSPQQERTIARLIAARKVPEATAWRTCRDAFDGLGEPHDLSPFANHRPQPGAKSYPGHTGSPLDEPAKALKAGAHGVPGGENMLLLPDGRVRYFSVREAARLQGMPDDYEFPGAWSESMRQLGNAVPSQLAEVFGRMMAECLGRGGER
jgi:DNA (cytosine-5)-methyltransferase 1